MILFPTDTFPFWLNNQRELVKLVHIGIQGKKTVEQFAKQMDIALSGKSIAVVWGGDRFCIEGKRGVIG